MSRYFAGAGQPHYTRQTLRRLLLVSAILIVASPIIAAPPPCPVAAFAWASAAQEQAAAKFAWACACDPKAEPAPTPPSPPKPPTANNVKPLAGGWVSIKGWHFPQANECSEPGNHWHGPCACGRICQHSNDNKGDIAAHTCVCGRVNLDKAEAGPVVRQTAPSRD